MCCCTTQICPEWDFLFLLKILFQEKQWKPWTFLALFDKRKKKKEDVQNRTLVDPWLLSFGWLFASWPSVPVSLSLQNASVLLVDFFFAFAPTSDENLFKCYTSLEHIWVWMLRFTFTFDKKKTTKKPHKFWLVHFQRFVRSPFLFIVP